MSLEQSSQDPDKRSRLHNPNGGVENSSRNEIRDSSHQIFFQNMEGTLQQKVEHGFITQKEQTIKEVGGLVRILRHAKTDALVISVQNHDENKLFWVGLKTPANESTGVAHILEHSVLCGSEKYPLKDPFIQLLRGSMNTFINAFTGNDRTMYPIASTNDQDFMNQSSVYLDAVFHPLLKREAFLQEGWRYDFDPVTGNLIRSGIVYNEMKGAYSDPNRRLYRAIQRSLFPDTELAYDSGGEPASIPSLTYERFVDFHRQHYHPSNSCIVIAGNHDPEKMLSMLDHELSRFEKGAVTDSIRLQQPFPEPIAIQESYPVDPNQSEQSESTEKAYCTVNWCLGEVLDSYEQFCLYVLDYVLLMSPSAPLRRAAIESGLGDGIATWGIDTSSRQATFSFGLKGVSPSDCTKVETLILETLSTIVRDSFEVADIDAGLNKLEFSLRENDTGGTPQGMAVARSLMTAWIYGHDLIDSIQYENHIDRFRMDLDQNPRLLEERIEHYLLQNSHRSTLHLLPDPTLSGVLAEKETSLLSEIDKTLTPEERTQIRTDLEALKSYQEAQDSAEALATIPRLTVADLRKQVECIPTHETSIHGVPVVHHEVETNGLSYVKALFTLDALPENLQQYCPIFARLLFESGTSELSYVDFQRTIASATGGIRASVESYPVFGEDRTTLKLNVQGKSTDGKCTQLLELMEQALLKANLSDATRTLQIVKESRAAIENGVVASGHGIVSGRIRSRLTANGYVGEKLYGLSQLEFLRSLEKQVKEDWATVQRDLENIRASVIGKQSAIVSVTSSANQFGNLQDAIGDFLDQLPNTTVDQVIPEHRDDVKVEALIVPSEVHYVGKGVLINVPGKRLNEAFSVVEKYLGRKFLWDEVRVKGGAYGAIASLNTLDGQFVLASYRDKNLLETLDVYDEIAQHLTQVNLDQNEIEKLIISVISDIDRHRLPPAKGAAALSRYLMKLDDQSRQVMRDEIFSATIRDFRELGQALKNLKDHGYVAVLGPPSTAPILSKRYGDAVTIKQIF